MNAPTFAHGQMRLYLLTLLEHEPMHGYELMQAIESRFNGAYVPSAGTIYPRLAKLAEEGLITKESIGRKTVYAITDLGRTELETRKDETDQLEEEIDLSARHMADRLRSDISSSMRSLKDDLKSAMSGTSWPGDTRFGTASQASGKSSHQLESSAWRGESRESFPGGDSAAGGANLSQAERLIYRFGLDMHDTLRAADAVGALRPEAVDWLAGELADVTSGIRTMLSAR